MSQRRQVIAVKRAPYIWRVVFFALLTCLSFGLAGSADLFVSIIGWIWAILAGAGCVSMLCGVLFPANLVLSEEGFRIGGLRHRPLVRWRSVDRLWVLRTPLYGYVLYALADQPRREIPGLWLLRGLPSEADGRLMPFYELSAEELLEEMWVWKARYGA